MENDYFGKFNTILVRPEGEERVYEVKAATEMEACVWYDRLMASTHAHVKNYSTENVEGFRWVWCRLPRAKHRRIDITNTRNPSGRAIHFVEDTRMFR